MALKISITFLSLIAGLFVFTHLYSLWIEYKNPPTGKFIDVGGFNLHYVDIPAGPNADLPVMVFIHGASSNLRDQRLAFESPLKGRGRMIFLDRPGHGYSERGGPQYETPSKQAEAIADLLDKLSIKKAVIVGHSYGGAVTAAFAVHFPEKVKGLVFLAPATHRWPGGVNWYYDLAAKPFIGFLFTQLLALPGGLISMNAGIKSVFTPNTAPPDYYQKVAVEMVLRPKNFRQNARDVVALKQSVTALSPRYKEIKAPTVIITGDNDDIVLAYIHSKGLEKDIAGSRLIELKNVGHKPDYAGTAVVIKAIETVSR